MTNIKPLLVSFERELDDCIQQVWDNKDPGKLLAELALKSASLFEASKLVGDASYESLNESVGSLSMSDQLDAYLLNHVWADHLKSFFILWRDVLFQLQKAAILLSENMITTAGFNQLSRRSHETLQAAAEALKGIIEKEKEGIKKQKKGVERKIDVWKHQNDPWPVYKSQIQKLVEQSTRLNTQFNQLKKTATAFEEIRSLVKRDLHFCGHEIQGIKQHANAAVSFIAAHIKDKPKQIPPHLEEAEDKIAIRNHLNVFSTELEETLEILEEKIEVPVNVSEGVVYYKDINIKQGVRQWLESEILPLLYEIWELTDNVDYGMKMSLVNIRNRVIMVSNETNESGAITLDDKEASQPLLAFLAKEHKWEESFQQLEQLVYERLKEDFSVSNIYELQQPFLPIPLEYTINQFGIGRNKLAEQLKNWMRKLTGTVAQIKSSVAKEEMLSVFEKVVRFIQARKGSEDNDHYASIFLTKGYLGESFWVGRENEIAHLQNAITQWQAGYRGSVMLTGSRHCGKSLFGDLVANRFFHDNTIRLKPNTEINLNGRKFNGGFDLGAILDFIKKHALHERSLIWIDDLELWKGDGHGLHENIRRLNRHIDDNSARFFYLVATSSWTQAHLNRTFEFNKIFQSEINLDRMAMDEIRRAILIRHGATHKTLQDENGEEMNAKKFGDLIAKIYKKEEGNIGDVLNQWAFSTKKVDQERVTNNGRTSYVLPDFLDPDIGVLLSAIMIEKRTNEYRLRKMFGPAFTDKYAQVLKRLLHIGVLIRQLDGWLELNEVVVNDTARLLNRKNYLTFSHKNR